MGGACCVAARDRTIHHGSSGEVVHRNIRHSPTWSFRWDNRVGVAGEDASVGWLSDVASRNDSLDMKSATDVSAQVSAHVSDGGGSLENYQMGAWHKSPMNQETVKNLRSSASGRPIATNASTEVKQPTEYPQVSGTASVKKSPSVRTTSSLCVSPMSHQSNLLPPSPTPSTLARGSPGHQLTPQPSDINSSGRNSPEEERRVPYGISIASNESTRGSYGRSSDGWSAHAFSELMSASRRERWSFDSDGCSFTRDKLSRTSGRNSGSVSMDFQACGICSKLLNEKSAWSSQKIIAGNDLSVVAVLICGHVYHAECLETITPEINKYDPACPVCTFGEKQTLKLSGKMLKAEKDLKARNKKKSRSRVVDTDGSFDFDYWKSSPHEGKNPKLSNSSSLKISSAKPFLKRHFSFGSRSNKSSSESSSMKKKGLFWAKSSRQ